MATGNGAPPQFFDRGPVGPGQRPGARFTSNFGDTSGTHLDAGSATARTKIAVLQDFRDAGGGTLTPDTRIMIPLL